MVRRLGVAAVLLLVAMAAVAMAAALAPWPVAAQQSGLALSESDRARLGVALSRLDEVAQQGGWPAIPDGPALRPGDRGERVAALRRRLAVTDGAPARVADGALFDRELEAAVRRAQLRHGLDVDGVVGRATLAALNVPADRVPDRHFARAGRTCRANWATRTSWSTPPPSS
jgi:murein L,D-transpeptidase YcbB/YkuD